jgi:AcrR family transcriptional regulator
MNKIDTKEKIIETAGELFAQKGYEGTSVRDIAAMADVNLASINYHYENKQNLYYEVFCRNWKWLANGINEIGEDKDQTVQDLASSIFDFFIHNTHALMNCFKIALNQTAPLPEKFPAMDGEMESFGPPGGDVIFEFVTKELGEEVPRQARLWCVASIFTHIEYMALIANTPYVKKKCEEFFHIQGAEELKSRTVRHQVDAVMNYVRDYGHRWNEL